MYDIRINSVHMYAIKSTAAATVDGKAPTRLEVGRTGFVAHGVADRQWLLEDPSAHFVSQRGWAGGTQKTSHHGDSKLARIAVDIRSDYIDISAPSYGQLQLSSDLQRSAPGQQRTNSTMRIHGQDISVIDEGDAAAKFFTTYLGRGVRLKRVHPDRPRRLDGPYVYDGASNVVGGADGMSFLLGSIASLKWLNERAGLSGTDCVPIDRYRLNIAINGAEPFAEDSMRLIRAGNFLARIVKPCKRCTIPNYNQQSGVPDGLSNKILGVRAGDIAVAGAASNPGLYFNQNLNHYWPYESPVHLEAGMMFEVVESAAASNIRLRAAT